jgi:gas vesicle protein
MMIFQKKQNVAKRVAIGSAIAGLLGYVAGVLTAPKSGKETRKDIQNASAKSVAAAEKELKKLHTELDGIIKQAKSRGSKLSTKAKQELDALVIKAKDAKEKTREVLSAIHEGGADNKELDKAIKDANDSIEHLKQYLKKK